MPVNGHSTREGEFSLLMIFFRLGLFKYVHGKKETFHDPLTLALPLTILLTRGTQNAVIKTLKGHKGGRRVSSSKDVLKKLRKATWGW